jgi:hypothetical protein
MGEVIAALLILQKTPLCKYIELLAAAGADRQAGRTIRTRACT